MFTEQIPIFQEGMFVRRTDTNLPGAHFMGSPNTDFPGRYVCSPNRYKFSRSPFYGFTEQIAILQEPLFWLSNRYRFSRSTFLATIQIPIFQEHFLANEQMPIFQEHYFFWLSNRYRFSRSTLLVTEQILIFQEAYFKYYRTDRQFPGRYRYRWLLSKITNIVQLKLQDTLA